MRSWVVEEKCLTNSVYPPRQKHQVQPQAIPRQINLVGLKRLDGGTYGDCKLPGPRVKQSRPIASLRRQSNGFTTLARQIAGRRQEMLVAAKNRGNLAREDGGE
ncbi:MAG TPA: hypothetical protein PKL59_23265, partial [Nitrospira sp.]|nr:hypothetical protein [Nitrospira sp.]